VVLAESGCLSAEGSAAGVVLSGGSRRPGRLGIKDNGLIGPVFYV
jgi:hypothetical protein